MSLRQSRVRPTFPTGAGHLQHRGHFELGGSQRLVAVGGGRGSYDMPVVCRGLGVHAVAAGAGIWPRLSACAASDCVPELRAQPAFAHGIAVRAGRD